MKLLAQWLLDNWRTMPSGVRALLYVVAFGAGVVVGLKFWESGWLQERLNMTATKQDITEQFDQMKAETAQHTALVVNEALRNYTDSLQEIRRAAEDTILQPMLRSLIGLDRRVGRVEKQLDMADEHMRDRFNRTEGQLERLVKSSEQDDTRTAQEEMLQQVLEELRELKEERAPEQQKKRNNKVKL